MSKDEDLEIIDSAIKILYQFRNGLSRKCFETDDMEKRSALAFRAEALLKTINVLDSVYFEINGELTEPIGDL